MKKLMRLTLVIQSFILIYYPIGKTYEINELYNTGEIKLINIAQQIKEASAKAMKECIETEDPDFSIFGEIELRAIKEEEKIKKSHKKYAKNITKSILQTNHGYWPKPNNTNYYSNTNAANGNNANDNDSKDNREVIIVPQSLHHIIKDEQYKHVINKVIDNNIINS